MRLIPALFALFLAVLDARAGQPLIYLDDPELMARLEAKGYGFAAVFGNGAADDLETLYREAPAYRQIVDAIAAGDPSVAEHVARTHIARARDAYLGRRAPAAPDASPSR